MYKEAKLGLSSPVPGFLCSRLCTKYATRTSQWVNSPTASRIIQNICEQGRGAGQAVSVPQWRQAEVLYLATEISGTPHRAAPSQLFTRQEVVRPTDLSRDPEPPSSLQPLAISQQRWRERP